MGKKRCTAVLLAAGKGSRMNSSVAKQFMELNKKPLIYYSLQTIQQSSVIDDCILVTGENQIEWVKQEIVEKFGFTKVADVIAGGPERCFSVAYAMKYIEEGKLQIQNKDGYVFIHDGARPFLSEDILKRTYDAVEKHRACTAAVPCKDPIKIADAQGFVYQTPARELMWSIQTPQVFDTELITFAYGRLLEKSKELEEQGKLVTDDAGVVELFTDIKVKLVHGSYENIKITTPEDILIAEAFMKEKQ